jgi:hypothetical protein
MTKISDALTYGLTIRESATDGSDFSNPATDYRRLFLGEDGALHLRDSAGNVTATAGTETLPASIIAAKGDLIVGTANDTAAILTAGTNGKVLTAASGEATGLKWDTAAAGDTRYWDTTTRTITNSTTETDMFPAQSIVGGTLGTTGGIRITAIGNLTHSVAGTCTVRVYYGGTGIATVACTAGATTPAKPFVLRATILNLGSESAQEYEIGLTGNDATGDNRHAYWRFAIGTAAANTAATGDFKMTAQWGAASASLSCSFYAALVEILA